MQYRGKKRDFLKSLQAQNLPIRQNIPAIP